MLLFLFHFRDEEMEAEKRVKATELIRRMEGVRSEPSQIYVLEHYEIRKCFPFHRVSQGDNFVSFLLKLNLLSLLPLSPITKAWIYQKTMF